MSLGSAADTAIALGNNSPWSEKYKLPPLSSGINPPVRDQGGGGGGQKGDVTHITPSARAAALWDALWPDPPRQAEKRERDLTNLFLLRFACAP